jgi:hypothetical protein
MQFNSSQVSFFNGLLDFSNPSEFVLCFVDRMGRLREAAVNNHARVVASRLLIRAYCQETADVVHASQIQNRMGPEIYTTLEFLNSNTFEFHAFSINKYEDCLDFILGFKPSPKALAWAVKACEDQRSLYVCNTPEQPLNEKDLTINPEDVRLIAKVSKVIEQPHWHDVWLQCTFGPQSDHLRHALRVGSGFRIAPIGSAQVSQRRCLRKQFAAFDMFDGVTSTPVIFRDITDIFRLAIHHI